jgi:hypothetical protein
MACESNFWQNRYYSCPLDRIHQWTALAYVERNPVRAGMVSLYSPPDLSNEVRAAKRPSGARRFANSFQLRLLSDAGR